jgi:hypothetical protein
MQKQWKDYSFPTKMKMRMMYPDRDGDGVPDKWDCQPLNFWKDVALPSGVGGGQSIAPKVTSIPAPRAHLMPNQAPSFKPSPPKMPNQAPSFKPTVTKTPVGHSYTAAIQKAPQQAISRPSSGTSGPPITYRSQSVVERGGQSYGMSPTNTALKNITETPSAKPGIQVMKFQDPYKSEVTTFYTKPGGQQMARIIAQDELVNSKPTGAKYVSIQTSPNLDKYGKSAGLGLKDMSPTRVENYRGFNSIIHFKGDKGTSMVTELPNIYPKTASKEW